MNNTYKRTRKKLIVHLNQVGQEERKRMELLMNQMTEKQGVIEQ